jgi:hypothetical protein
MKSEKLRRVSGALAWRQRFMNCEEYEYTFNDNDKIGALNTTISSSTGRGVTLRLKQIGNGEMKGLGTGTFVWPASHVLGKYLERRFSGARSSEDRSSMLGKTVCDVGSGTGLPGYVAARLGAVVSLTDQVQLLTYMEDNKRSAIAAFPDIFSDDNLLVREYNWGESTDHLGAPFDIVLVSDCVLPKLYPIEMLVSAVRAVMGETSVAFFSYEHRVYPLFDPRDEFKRLLDKYGMQMVVIPLDEQDPVYSCDDIELWRVTLVSSSAATSTSSTSKE